MKSACDPSETFTDRSPLGTELMIIKCKLGSLSKRTNHAVVVQDTLQLEDFENLATELRAARFAIITWRRNFNMALINIGKRCNNDTADFGKRHELLGLSLIVNIVFSRLLVCIVPNDRVLLEEEVQNLAIELKALKKSIEHNRRAELLFVQKSIIANAAIDTHAYFQDEFNSGKIVVGWRLDKFFQAMGRKSCDGETCCDLNR
jgi:hypothetical protein